METKDGIGTIVKRNDKEEYIIATNKQGKVCLIDIPRGTY